MCRKIMSVFFFLLSVSAYSQDAQRWYLISESELQSIETLSRTWEASKQSWLSQVKQLKTTVLTLQSNLSTTQTKLQTTKDLAQRLSTESVDLNKTLADERKSTQALRKSYEQYALDLSSENDKLKLENKYLDMWRGTALVLIAIILAVFAFSVYRKIKG